MNQEPGNKGKYTTAVIVTIMLALASFLYFAFPGDKWFGIPLAIIFFYYRLFLEPKWKKKHQKPEEEAEEEPEEEVDEGEEAEGENTEEEAPEEETKDDPADEEEEEEEEAEYEEEETSYEPPSGLFVRFVLGAIIIAAVSIYAFYQYLKDDHPVFIAYVPYLVIAAGVIAAVLIIKKNPDINKPAGPDYNKDGQEEIVREWEKDKDAVEEEAESTEGGEETPEDEETEEEETTGDDEYEEEEEEESAHEGARELSYNDLSGSSAGRDDFLTHVGNNIRIYGIILSMLIAGAYVYFTRFAGKQQANGEIRDYYENTNTVKETYQVINGKKEGAFKRFDRFGNLIAEGGYKSGALDGLFVKYNLDGSIEKSFYADGEIKGVVQRMEGQEGGGLQKPADVPVIPANYGISTAVNEPELEGFIWSSFLKSRRENQIGYNWEKKGLSFQRTYENGKIMEEGQYVKKVTLDAYEKYLPDGTWKYYNENGKLYMEKVYDKGNPARTLHYDNAGKLIAETE